MEIKKILIFGAGVIGSVYAGKLSLAGHSVSVLARNNRLNELQLNGLLLSENGKELIKTNVTIISELKADDIYDYIFVTLRKDQVKDALQLLGQNQSKNFVFMVNTSSGYADWISQIGLERVIPAFPGAGGKIENGIVYYSLTSRFIQPTTLGEIDGKATQRTNELAKILSNAGFSTSITVFFSTVFTLNSGVFKSSSSSKTKRLFLAKSSLLISCFSVFGLKGDSF